MYEWEEDPLYKAVWEKENFIQRVEFRCLLPQQKRGVINQEDKGSIYSSADKEGKLSLVDSNHLY